MRGSFVEGSPSGLQQLDLGDGDRLERVLSVDPQRERERRRTRRHGLQVQDRPHSASLFPAHGEDKPDSEGLTAKCQCVPINHAGDDAGVEVRGTLDSEPARGDVRAEAPGARCRSFGSAPWSSEPAAPARHASTGGCG